MSNKEENEKVKNILGQIILHYNTELKMDDKNSKINNQMSIVNCSKTPSNTLNTSSIVDTNFTDNEHHHSISDSRRRSRYNSSDGSTGSYLNSIFNSLQSWQSGQSVNTWMPQTLWRIYKAAFCTIRIWNKFVDLKESMIIQFIVSL